MKLFNYNAWKGGSTGIESYAHPLEATSTRTEPMYLSSRLAYQYQGNHLRPSKPLARLTREKSIRDRYDANRKSNSRTTGNTHIIHNTITMATSTSTSATKHNDVDNDNDVIFGPDLNGSKSPLDKKLYRQILLPNGIRAVLISDTVAINQSHNNAGMALGDEDVDDDDGDNDSKSIGDSDDDDNDDYEDEDDNNSHNDNHDDNSNDGDEDEDEDEDEDDEDDDVVRSAACNVVVGAGSFYDPPDCQGLAHFLEHLLFMGSGKYPAENEYSSYLNKHGGMENAYTEDEYTSYYFSIPAQEQLSGALDRLGRFFVDPLMLESAVERELQAIESEFQLKKNSDAWRLHHLWSVSCKQQQQQQKQPQQEEQQQQEEHPFSRFGLGNYKSLKEMPEENNVDTMERLRTFFNKYYYGLNMRIVVVGAYPLDTLQQYVMDSFRDVPMLPRDPEQKEILQKNNNDIASWDSVYQSPLKELDVPFYCDDNDMTTTTTTTTSKKRKSNEMSTTTSLWNKLYHIIPVKERHTLSVVWQLPSQMGKWKTKPYDYLSNLIGHEGKGSLLSALKHKSWVVGCVAGMGGEGSENSSFHSFFNATFILSKEGVNQWSNIVSKLYQYIGMLRYYYLDDVRRDDGKEDIATSNNNNNNSNNNNPHEYLYEEFKMMQEISYRFSDEPDPEELVESIAETCAPHLNMPPERILDGVDLWFEYNPTQIQKLLNSLTPKNARIELMTSTYGRTVEYENNNNSNNNVVSDATNEKSAMDLQPQGQSNGQHQKEQQQEQDNQQLRIIDASAPFHPQKNDGAIPAPSIDPWFGTPYWVQELSPALLQKWSDLAEAQLPSTSSDDGGGDEKDSIVLSLPPKNPFVPEKFDLKPLPPDDCNHPLLNHSLKLCITVGKKKQWFPATVTQFNSIKNEILLSYEDEDEQWHTLDHQPSELTSAVISHHDFEGTLDNKKIKYRVVAFALAGDGAVRKFGDESDFDVEDGKGFPPIPPARSKSRLPKVIHDTQVLKLWHLQDRKFHRPIAELRLKLVCGQANATALHRACAEILSEMCADALTETSYMASLCELDWSITTNDVGFYLRVHGFDDKLVDFFCNIFRTLLSFRGMDGKLPPMFKEERFEACLELLRRKYANDGMVSSGLSTDIRVQCLRPTLWSSNKKMKAVEDITVELFSKTISEVLQKVAVEALFHGNVDEADANDLKTRIVDLIESPGGGGLAKKKYPLELVSKLPVTTENQQSAVVTVPSRDPTDSNTAVEVYFQIGKDNIKDRVITDMLATLMAEPVFDQIRTKDQFGYSVSCDSRWTNGIMGFYFKIVTASKSAAAATERIEKFIKEYRQTLTDMSNDDFVEQLVGLAKNKLDMCNSLSEETGLFWAEIREGSYDFDVKRNEVICLRNLTKEQVLAAFDKWLHGGKRRMMVVEVIGGGGKDGSDACIGRPQVGSEKLRNFLDEKVQDIHANISKGQTWGKVF